MRGKTIEILHQAMENGSAVGAFNTFNLESTQAIARAAHQAGKPCIIQTTINSLNYTGYKMMSELVKSAIDNESNSTIIGFHLDHGKTFDDIIQAIEIDVDSVMIDGSTLSLKENIALTKRVVEYAHSKDISVQAELGRVPYLGREEIDVNWEEVMTKPEEAKELVEETGVDALAVGIGNAHGFFREKDVPDWERLEKIRALVPNTPLILHGASDWSSEKIKKAITGGICCFNIDTDIRIAFSTALCKMAGQRCDVSDPRKMLSKAREETQQAVREKIELFSKTE